MGKKITELDIKAYMNMYKVCIEKKLNDEKNKLLPDDYFKKLE